jgi:RNA polymerase sigma factor (sigma-70 family)
MSETGPRAIPASPLARDEQALVRAARAGDGVAYGELVRLHQGAVLRTARYLGAGDAAADAAQEAFVIAWRSLPRFVDGMPFRPWIVKIVTNEVRNKQRNRKRRAEIVAEFAPSLAPADAPGNDTEIVHNDGRRLLREAISRLPERQRLVVAYRYLLELTEQETADALGWPRGTVKSRLSRALARLRDDPSLGGLLDSQA